MTITAKELFEQRGRSARMWGDAARPGRRPNSVKKVDEGTGEVLHTYVSQAEAARSIGGQQSKMSSAIKSGDTYKGFRWCR